VTIWNHNAVAYLGLWQNLARSRGMGRKMVACHGVHSPEQISTTQQSTWVHCILQTQLSQTTWPTN